jgi:hypothetical protein
MKSDKTRHNKRKETAKKPYLSEKDKLEAENFAENAGNQLKRLFGNFRNESKETKQMAEVFFKMLEQKLKLHERSEPPTPEEVKQAIEQLKDVGRIGFFASVSILPGGAFSLLGIELLARKFGIKNFTFAPSSFRKKPSGKGISDRKNQVTGKLKNR